MTNDSNPQIDNQEGMSNEEFQGWMLVAAQLIAIAVNVGVGILSFPWPIVSFIPIAIGLFLFVWAGLSIKRSLRIHPTPNQAGLVTKGPYGFIRHPMYTGLLLVSLGFQLGSPWRNTWLLYGFLCLVLISKAMIEEEGLSKAYPDFAEYKRKTKRLIPFIF